MIANKPTDKNIANFFGTTTQTLRNWKKKDSPKKLNERYIAFKERYIKVHNS